MDKKKAHEMPHELSWYTTLLFHWGFYQKWPLGYKAWMGARWIYRHDRRPSRHEIKSLANILLDYYDVPRIEQNISGNSYRIIKMPRRHLAAMPFSLSKQLNTHNVALTGRGHAVRHINKYVSIIIDIEYSDA